MLLRRSLALLALLSATACSEEPSTPPSPTVAPSAAPLAVAPAAANANAAGDDSAPSDAGADAPYDGPRLGALFLTTSILSEMDFPREGKNTVRKLGYLRQGTAVPVNPEPVVKANCREGWYALLQGGYVCGKYATLDLNHPKIKLAPHPPDLNASLPYQYGYNLTNGTPLYRTIPSSKERLELEPWLRGGAKRARPSADPAAASTSTSPTFVRISATTPASNDGDGELDAGVPWYLQDFDGGKPTVTLDALQGEGPIARRMVRGFYLSLDGEVEERGAKWWKTIGGLLTPHARIMVQKPLTEFHGMWLQQGDVAPPADLAREGARAQVGFVMRAKARRYAVDGEPAKATAGETLEYRTVVRLTGKSLRADGKVYDETLEGYWVRADEITRTKPGPMPRDLKPGEKWIDVNIKNETLVAYEGDKAVYATLVSTGRKEPEKNLDYTTPTGTFRIREKHVAATMDGDVASDSPYSIEDVPWVMYYSGSYALHGAFWHASFGRTKSHGCTNLAPEDARQLFGWTEPRLPEGWHGVWATSEQPGTRVVVHE